MWRGKLGSRFLGLAEALPTSRRQGHCHRELTLQPSCPFLAPQPRNCPSPGLTGASPQSGTSHKAQVPMSAGQSSCTVPSSSGDACKSLYLLGPRPSTCPPVPPQRWPSGAPVSFEQTPGFQLEERPGRGSGCQQPGVESPPLRPACSVRSCCLPINHGVQWTQREPGDGPTERWGLEECRGRAGQAPARA